MVKKLLFCASLFVLLIFCYHYLPGPKNDPEAGLVGKNQSGAPETGAPEIILKRTRLSLFTNNGSTDCIILAQESKIFSKKHPGAKPLGAHAECSIITCSLTTKTGMVAYLTAPHASIYHEKKELFLPCVVTGSLTKHDDHRRPTWNITTENVHYQAKKEYLTVHNVILTVDGKMSITAPQGSIDLKTEEILLQGGVVSVFTKQ